MRAAAVTVLLLPSPAEHLFLDVVEISTLIDMLFDVAVAYGCERSER